MKPPFDILVAGEINPDLIPSGNVIPEFGQAEKLVDSADLPVGSSSAIFACGAARLGLKVAFSGICETDIFGRFMLDELSQGGVDVSGVIIHPLLPTGLSVILNGPLGDRAILTHAGAINRLQAEQVTPDRLQTALQTGLPDLFQRAHALGLTTSLDSNWEPSGEWRGFDDLLGRVDIFLPNEKEALAISGLPNTEATAKALARKSHLVAVKQGGRGALACSGDTLIHAPAVPVQIVDSFGAGDSFDAGFLYGFLNGWSLEKTLFLAATCGFLSTRRPGGTAGQPTLVEAVIPKAVAFIPLYDCQSDTYHEVKFPR
ncbi:MAG: sugar kinase [Anaerolineales bacterium]|jgi:sugar/nucleoside kinase (ribokinase family)